MRHIFKLAVCASFALAGARAARAQLSLSTVVEMALRNSPQVRMGTADVNRAAAGVDESRSVYTPSLVLGSSLGRSYGFPLGQPEVFSLTAQSLVFSYSQRDYIRAARKALESAQLQLKDTRQQVVLDVSLDYIELAKVEQQMAALDQESGYAQKLAEIEQQRVDTGYDSKILLTRARLAAAQVKLRRLHFADQAELLHARLARLTGLPLGGLNPDPKTIPAVEIPAANRASSSAGNSNDGVQAAYAAAKSKLYTAFGDSRQNNRPTVSFVATYGLFSSDFNNYSQYYRNFQDNNAGAGVQINIPFFDAGKRAKAQESSADAVHAAAQADGLRDQTSEQILQLEKSLPELEAQEQVAELQNQLAEDQLEAVGVQVQSGSANPQAAPLTPRDEEQARINERNQYVDLLDSRFQLTQAQLNLLRALGSIESWAGADHRQP